MLTTSSHRFRLRWTTLWRICTMQKVITNVCALSLVVIIMVNCTKDPSDRWGLPKEEALFMVKPTEGKWKGSRQFTFPNDVIVEVRSSTKASFTIDQNLTENPFKIPTEILTLKTSAGKFVIVMLTRAGNRTLEVNGKKHHVPLKHLLMINETGDIKTSPLH